jgi:hypothetical protein
MNRDDVAQQLTSATEQRQQALARLQAAEARAEELAEPQSAIRGEVSIARNGQLPTLRTTDRALARLAGPGLHSLSLRLLRPHRLARLS